MKNPPFSCDLLREGDFAVTRESFDNMLNIVDLVGYSHVVTATYAPCERTNNKRRIRMRGLWFDEDELRKITKENDPEYFL